MKFILYQRGGKLRLGLGEPTDPAGSAFRVTNDSGRKEKASQKSVLYAADFKGSGDPTTVLARMREEAQEIADTVDTDLVWDSFAGRKARVVDLARLWFGRDELDPAECAGVAMALAGDSIRFKVSEGRVVVLDRETVEQNLSRAERERNLEEEVEKAASYLLALLDGREAEHPNSDEILDWVEAAAQGLPEDRLARAVFDRIRHRLRPYRSALVAILKRGGRSPDVPSIILSRFQIAREFSKEAMDQAAELADDYCDPSDRRDMTHLYTFSIDGAHTRDFDDAISVEVHDEFFEVWMHIADCSLIEPDSPLDHEAYERISTLYLPDRRIPMLPTELSEDCLSLKAGVVRRALTHYFKLDRSAKLLDFDLFPSVVSVDTNLSYEQAEEVMGAPANPLRFRLEALIRLRDWLLAERKRRGARPFWRREVKLWLDDEGRVHLTEIDRNSVGMRIVEEFAILTNALVADFCSDRKIPALFRVPRPAGVVLSFEPGFHSGLGLDAYVQVTSPIRRYTDLLMQRQLSHWLATNEPLYTEDVDFLMRAKDAERRFVELRQAADQIEQYWKMVYIQQNMDATFTVVLPRSGIPYIYELVLQIAHPLPPWMAVRSAAKARVKSVDPDAMKVELDIIERCPLPWEGEGQEPRESDG